MKRLIAGGVVAAVAVFGGAGAFDDDTVRDDSGSIVEGGGLGAFVIQVGDCFNLPDSTLVASIEAVPCAQPHDAEAYATFDQLGNDYPGALAVEEASLVGCYERFAPFVGADYETSELDFYWLEPTEESWNELDDRETMCAIVAYDGSKLTGSMRGAGI